MLPSAQLEIGGAARRTRGSGLMRATVVLLELTQDLVAVASLDGGDVHADSTIVSGSGRRWFRRSGGRRRRVGAGKHVVRRRDLDAVQIERAEHAQRCGAVPGRRLFRSAGCLAVVLLVSRASGVELVNARQRPASAVPTSWLVPTYLGHFRMAL